MLSRVQLVFWFAVLVQAQTDTGELRFAILDQAGAPVASSVMLSSQANHYAQSFATDAQGKAIARRLPYGLYRVTVAHDSFMPYASQVEVRSALPAEVRIQLSLSQLSTTVEVTETEALIDPHRTGNSNRIASSLLQERPASQPGRSLEDLVNTQPGWLLEANGVLHPRGSEYQTQYVVDGLPMTDNRSPNYAPEIQADDVQSMNILTGDYPAEYGRKLGGVIEVNTAHDARPGLHGKIGAGGGSFGTVDSNASVQYGFGANTLGLSGGGARTDRFLDPPVEQNFSNRGTTESSAARYERDLSSSDRLNISLRRGTSRFLVPNELPQNEAGQRQDRTSEETAALLGFQHVFSPSLLGDVHFMTRDVSSVLWSNDLATPIAADQDRGFREAYLKGSVSAHRGMHELKLGVEADFASIRENFDYRLTDPTQFDDGTPATFRFSDHRQDREQSVFAQDLIRLGPFTVNAGIRFDHYRVIVDESAWSPRLGAAYYIKRADLLLRASYDRVFQTPAFENLLLASSPQLSALNSNVLRLPVRPSRGNFYEAGFSKGVARRLRLDVSFFRRALNRFADDDVLLNTGVSFPISFARADIRGAEVKAELVQWGKLSGFMSWTNMRGSGYLPVTGGLFLGADSASALNQTGSFPITQDQRNSVRSRLRYQLPRHFWFAGGAEYGSGLPAEFAGTYDAGVAQAGERIASRVNFSRGRVRPSFSVDASVGAELRKTEKSALRIQVDAINLTNRLNVINFASLFSGTALAPPRTFSTRVSWDF
jgi:outer membrane cobalamin receptor